MNIIKGTLTATNSFIAVIVARFNHFINDKLLEGAIDSLERIGQILKNNITVIWVPGVYELPLIIKILAKSKKYDAIIALGTIIRGNTKHFKYLSNDCISSISSIGINNEIPIALGILTTENIEQAIERSGSKLGNKGVEAALTALEMINVINKIKNK
ncbi:6,7-dimethyl-8-ribityllumazine synthase [Candidatus Providencia siddallii]|uniref:6,7-dimethyl-8-ribityllumazine synthase n=1 Tax=Candidatus Providencia siddallii TaxID=1715285 RepID=A0ABP1CE11_9GAMM